MLNVVIVAVLVLNVVVLLVDTTVDVLHFKQVRSLVKVHHGLQVKVQQLHLILLLHIPQLQLIIQVHQQPLFILQPQHLIL